MTPSATPRWASIVQNMCLNACALFAHAGGHGVLGDDIVSSAGRERLRDRSLARDGDQLVINKLDRLGRSLEHLIALSAQLQTRGVVSRPGFEGDVESRILSCREELLSGRGRKFVLVRHSPRCWDRHLTQARGAAHAL
jgi:hypothetical protein